MELSASEKKLLKGQLKAEERIRRHPLLLKIVIWATLGIAGLHLIELGSSALKAYRLAHGPEYSWANGFVPNPGELSVDDYLWKVIEANAALTGFWQEICRAVLSVMAALFFVMMFFWLRSHFRFHRLLIKLRGRVQELETAGGG